MDGPKKHGYVMVQYWEIMGIQYHQTHDFCAVVPPSCFITLPQKLVESDQQKYDH